MVRILQRPARRGAAWAAAALVAALMVLSAAAAPAPAATRTLVSSGLLSRAAARPAGLFHVVVQGRPGSSTAAVAGAVSAAMAQAPDGAARISDRYRLFPGVAADLSGAQVAALTRDPSVLAVTADGRVLLTAAGSSAGGFSNEQDWPRLAGATHFWSRPVAGPAIAVVDSGVDAGLPDFGGRVRASVDLDSGTTPNSAADGFGHGTFVAAIAAGAGSGHAGYAPQAPIVSLDVMDDQGMARTSDVIAAADWIYRHARHDDIRVANFSLVGSVPSSFMYDPLDRAVEALWHSGVVVVAAAGNYASGGAPSGVRYAPGNDPFVITVGAADLGQDPARPVAAPWSSYGFTPDGFRKPELCAPGRALAGPVPTASTIYRDHGDRIVSPGEVWMSGTSFAAPVVAGAAEQLLARHPRWTPDQVKGALMLSAAPTAGGAGAGCGVGEVDGAAADAVASPPDPNAALERFVVARGAGAPPRFDSEAWKAEALRAPAWDAASWDSSQWRSAAWDSASWDSAAWDSASWDSASWDSATAPAADAGAGAALVWVR